LGQLGVVKVISINTVPANRIKDGGNEFKVLPRNVSERDMIALMESGQKFLVPKSSLPPLCGMLEDIRFSALDDGGSRTMELGGGVSAAEAGDRSLVAAGHENPGAITVPTNVETLSLQDILAADPSKSPSAELLCQVDPADMRVTREFSSGNQVASSIALTGPHLH
jgi:hypothetical protein